MPMPIRTVEAENFFLLFKITNQSFENSRTSLRNPIYIKKMIFQWQMLTLILFFCAIRIPANALQCNPTVFVSYSSRRTAVTTPLLSASSSHPSEDVYNNDDDIDDQQMQRHLKDRHNAIQIEKAREKLESANTQSFLKRKPRKLPYEDARRWVQANLGCDTAEEYDDLVANGNLRTPYIPKRPEEYYTETREWISWEHFLKGCFDEENPSAVKPRTGIFDWDASL